MWHYEEHRLKKKHLLGGNEKKAQDCKKKKKKEGATLIRKRNLKEKVEINVTMKNLMFSNKNRSGVKTKFTED